MSKNIREIPFTEIVERTAKTARSTDDLQRVRGAVNLEYTHEIQRKEDWNFLISTTAIACTPQSRTGTASVNTQATAVTFSSDVVLDASFTGRKIKFTGNSNVYDFTFSNTTGGTINPPLSGTVNISAGAYTIFQPIYALPRDFSRFPKNGGLLLYQGGAITPIPENSTQGYYRNYNPSPGTPAECRLVNAGTDGLQRLELTPPPADPLVFGCEYIQELEPMRESTAGFVDISAGGTTVTGSAGTTRFTEMSTGAFIRIDAFGTGEDSEWYRVAAIANNSSLTLQTAFGLSGATTARYTLCSAPELPPMLHSAIMYGAAMQIFLDQNDALYAFMSSQKSATIADARRVYKSRVYSQFLETVFEDYNYRR